MSHLHYLKRTPKLYTPSILNIGLILWHTHLIVCAENVKSWFKSWVFPFTFQAYTLPHKLYCMCVSLFKFHIWILEQIKCCPKRPALPRHIKVWVSFELFGALYMYISEQTTNQLFYPTTRLWPLFLKYWDLKRHKKVSQFSPLFIFFLSLKNRSE